MKQSLSINLSQRLAMTMQLQQAIQILQLSSQELRAVIEKEYVENPALEMDYTEGRNVERFTEGVPAEDLSQLAVYLDGDSKQPKYFIDDQVRGMEAVATVDLTLEDELMEQVKFTFFEEREREIAAFIVGCIDERGYFTVSIEEAMHATNADEATILGVLQKIQEFEPSGIGARSLKECLQIQARQRGIYEGLVAALIDKYLDHIATARMKEIAAEEQATVADVQLAVDILRTLNPKPGSSYGGEALHYIVPDVLVQEVDGRYVVTINDNYVPQLHISSMYRNAAGYDENTKKYIGQRLQAAAWLIKSIEQRRQTIRRVVEEIVACQKDSVEKGMKYLRPMTMKQVAEAIDVHESTVSRAVANKYVELPWGIVAIKKFFASRLAAVNEGTEIVPCQVKDAMEELIRGEDPKKPLSDQKLAELLEQRDMKISRRTVMKYREAMGYPSSVKRKRY